uniref:NADH-ubiquinone oxidoreductase chain 4 n=1 Tax=Pyropia yezoensis TaxID=2788 RepID=I0B710_PYRYE|nr:NADH dehydrogenase subunit 4 [Neopyropia yezoensis]AFH57678.1 NADH dehydrogenase subunit 4 [Neopyropia yezoensis]QGA30550.1 NADH dehydrogenase subunit 4 [Neopyropia yezoensis]
MQITNLLLWTSLIPLCGAILLIFIPRFYSHLIRNIAFATAQLAFIYSILLWLCFESTTSLFQFIYTINWFPSYNIYYTIGVDGISLFFIILTTWLITVCTLISWNMPDSQIKEYLICFLLLEAILIQVFCVLDVLFFYIFFESVLIPMFLIIGVWGSRERKIRAAYQFFIYTLAGSLLMLLAILTIYFQHGTTDIQVLWNINFDVRTQILLWLAFFASLAVKIPMIPFHIWLPEAHAEAPTAGSVILAGVLLKMGGYGFLRFSLPLFPEASLYFAPLIYLLSIIAAIYASLTTIRQVDLKKIIAYSSVSHMGFVTLGLFSFNSQGIEGSIILMLSHGLVSSALFLCVGILYDRHKTRLLKYYGGLVQVMPIFSILLLFFTFSNIGFPGTSSFVGELLVLMGVFQFSPISTFLSAFSMILGAGYSIWLFNRVCFGSLKLQYITNFQDISRREFCILFPLSVFVLWMGIYPEIFLSEIHCSSYNLIAYFN